MKIEYKSVTDFIQEAKAMGGENLFPSNHTFCEGELLEKLEALKKDTLAISVEIIYGHAWGSDLSQQFRQDNVISIPLRSLKRNKT